VTPPVSGGPDRVEPTTASLPGRLPTALAILWLDGVVLAFVVVMAQRSVSTPIVDWVAKISRLLTTP
jgi:hypothetical protein